MENDALLFIYFTSWLLPAPPSFPPSPPPPPPPVPNPLLFHLHPKKKKGGQSPMSINKTSQVAETNYP